MWYHTTVGGPVATKTTNTNFRKCHPRGFFGPQKTTHTHNFQKTTTISKIFLEVLSIIFKFSSALIFEVGDIFVPPSLFCGSRKIGSTNILFQANLVANSAYIIDK